jgi:hypothetical protein
MKRALLFVVVLSGCASAPSAPSQTTPARYQADVTYTMSAAAIAALADSGEDVKLTFKLQTGGDAGGVTSCTAQPLARGVDLMAPPPSLASRLTVDR